MAIGAIKDPGVDPDNVINNLINCTLRDAVGELINNSADAKATKIYVKLGKYKNEAAIFFMDDGNGFSGDGISAFLGLGKTTRIRNDRGTIGANGLGTKSGLIFGDIKSTKVTVISRSKDFPVGVKTFFNYERLVEVIEKSFDVKQAVDRTVSNDWGEFYQGWRRESGSTVIITGFNKISSNNDLYELLAERLSPRMAKKVWVWQGGISNGRYVLLETMKIQGEHYYNEHDSELLGNITFDLYHGGPNDGPLICGQENVITEYGKFAASLNRSELVKMKSVWRSIGGYVYIPNMNEYRLNNGSFLPSFSQSGAREELVTIFALIAEELEQFQQKVKTDEVYQAQKDFLKLLVQASQENNPEHPPFSKATGNKAGTLQPMEYGRMDIPVFIVPKQITLTENEEHVVVLKNQGTENLNFKAAIWRSENKYVNPIGNGACVRIEVGSKENVGESIVPIHIKGDFGEHILKVIVQKKSTKPYISGDKLVNPGTETEYQLHNSPESEIKWEVTKSPGVSLVVHDPMSNQVTLVIAKGTVRQTITLYAKKKSNNSIIAEREIRISDLSYLSSPKIKVGDQWFVVEFNSRYQTAAVQIEEYSEEEGLPSLYINSLHPLMRGVSASVWADVMINGIAFAATAYMTQFKGVSAQKAMNIAWEYIEATKNFAQKANSGKPKKLKKTE